MLRPRFSKSGTPSVVSRLFMAFVSVDWVINICSAAVVKLPVSAATRKYIRCCQFKYIKCCHSLFIFALPQK